MRVTQVNSKSNQGKPTADISKEHENEKERKYQQRVLDVEMGSFTYLVFGTNGGMGGECQMFPRQLAKKNDENYASVMAQSTIIIRDPQIRPPERWGTKYLKI